MRVILKTIKVILIAAIFIMLAALVYLLWTERDPASMRRLAWTREAVEAYERSPDGFRVSSVTGFDGRTYSQDGAVGVSRVARVVDLDEWQILVRYNDSTLRELEKTRGTVGYADTERFIFTLTDDLGNVYTDYHFVAAESSRHNYLRLIFDGVPLTFSSEQDDGEGGTRTSVRRVREMTLCIYCREDVGPDGELPASPAYFAYVYSDAAAQYDYKGLSKELPDGEPTQGIRSSAELYGKETGNDDP